jgi:hypothetical protein
MLVVALVAGDPITGSPLYVPRLGELAVIHNYDMSKNSVIPIVSGWTSAEALSKYEEELYDVFQSNEERNSAPSDQQIAVVTRLRTESRDRGNLIELPDMTKVRVLARGSFSRRFESTMFKYDPVFAIYWDACFVEVTDGPMKGRKAWVFKYFVRVPDSKDPYAGIELGPKNDEANDEKPAVTARRKGSTIEDVDVDQEKPQVQILDSAWKRSRSGNFVEVSCTVKNLSRFALSGLTANIIYKDENGRLINSKEWFIGDVAAGEENTFTAAHPSDPRMKSYVIEFDTTQGFKHVKVEVVTEDPRQSRARSQPKAKAGTRQVRQP